MKIDFLPLWELTLRPDLTDEELKNLIPSKFGNVHYAFDGVTFEKNVKSLIMLMGMM